MADFLLRRAIQGVAVVFIVATLTFFLIHLAPGDPFGSVLDDPRITEAVRAEWRARAGLDRPLPEQYARFLANVARGDIGWSYAFQRPVATVLAERLPRTLLLIGTALAASLLLGVAIGIAQARRPRSATDRGLGVGAVIFASIPEFWLALVVLLLLAYRARWFPAGGLVDPVMHEYLTPGGRVLDVARHLALPALTLTLIHTAGVSRLQRSALLDVLPEDYVRTARAKGLDERRVVLRHALRNALVPLITVLGLSLPALVGGAVFVEAVFSWPGMGSVAVEALGARDHQLVVAVVLLGSVVVVAGALLADVLYLWADPRRRVR